MTRNYCILRGSQKRKDAIYGRNDAIKSVASGGGSTLSNRTLSWPRLPERRVYTAPLRTSLRDGRVSMKGC